MKIYPGKHIIANVDKVDLNEEIALGYLDTDFAEEVVNIFTDESFSITETKEVLPYTIFTSEDEMYPEITLYNKHNIALTVEEQSSLLTRQANTNNYMYVPNAFMTYEPYTFNYKVLAKKDMNYLSSRLYNINVGCIDIYTAEKLIPYFSDSYKRNMCPTNIMFNNGDKKLESLLNQTLSDCDFVFIESEDGETYDGVTKIDVDDYIKNNVVPFIFCSKLPKTETELDYSGEGEGNIENDICTFELMKNSVVSTNPITTLEYFLFPEPRQGVYYHDIFKHSLHGTPVLIKEIVNKGHVVYCHKSILSDITLNFNLFYEIIMYVYLKAYVSTGYISEWITDVVPDYIVQNGRLTKKDKFTSHMELHKLLGLYERDVYPIEVIIEPPSEQEEPIVYYTGMSSNYLVFKKLYKAEYADPIKQAGQISVFTERKNIMYYDSFIYSMMENITPNISHSINNNTLTINIRPFKNSNLEIRNFNKNIVINYELKDLVSQIIYLVWDKNFRTIKALSNIENNRQVVLATMQISKDKRSTKLYDMRVRGGGLPESSKDNFDCLDIANTLGKAYRKGGALMSEIKLPSKYAEQEEELYEIIYDTIKKNMVSDDYLMLKLNFE